METTFKINTKELFTAIKKTGRLVPALKKAGNIKISVQPTDIVISCQGVEFTIPAETTGYVDIILPFTILYAIQATETASSLTFTVTQGSLKTEKFTINNFKITVQNLFTKKAIDLPINPITLDFLRLRNIHTEAQLREYNMLQQVEKAERQLEKDLSQALKILKPYNILQSDILELLEKKLK